MAAEDVPPDQQAVDDLVRPGVEQVAGGQAVQLAEDDHHDTHIQPDGLLDYDTAEARAWAEKGDREAGLGIAEMAGRVDSFEPDQLAGRETNARAFRTHMAASPLYNKLGSGPGYRGEVSLVAGTGIRSQVELESRILDRDKTGKDEVVQGMNSGAAEYERRAQRKGDWAQAIHEHPPTAEFLKAHGWTVEEVTPERLMRVEYVRDRLLAEADSWSDRLNALESRYADLIAQGETTDMVSMLAISMRADAQAAGDPEALNIFRDLASRDETTIGGLKQIYQTMCQVEADAIRHAVGNSDVVIAAIRSGEYPEPTEPAEQAA